LEAGGHLNELHLFAGAGGGILGGILLGHTCVCAVEIEPYCRKVLLQRQRDGVLPKFPIWDDVRTFDGKPWRGKVDVVCGGFPCQDISCAGKGGGIKGTRSGLWEEMRRVISEVRPKYAIIENSPMLTTRGGIRVIADLAGMGMSAMWGVIGGYTAGGCVDGKRIWIIANATNSFRRPASRFFSKSVDQKESSRRQFERASCACYSQEDHSGVLRNTDELARGMDRLKSVGNGQNPVLVKLAWETLGTV
jgi:DNA (cytosine-5)-methyltransferase 1